MAENSKIEWTDHTFNPWIGCTKIHEGCANCYAEADAADRRGLVVWGPQGTRRKTTEGYWQLPMRWNRAAELRGERAKVFCASWADVFEDYPGQLLDAKNRPLWFNTMKGQYTTEREARVTIPVGMPFVRAKLFELIDSTPWLQWLLLTKRPQNVCSMWEPLLRPDGVRDHGEFMRENVAIGTSISTQEHADKQLPELLKLDHHSKCLFVSIEPMLGPIDLTRIKWAKLGKLPYGLTGWSCNNVLVSRPEQKIGDKVIAAATPKLSWVIAGGESGRKARPSHPDWYRLLRDQCVAAGVPFLFKQWGEYVPLETLPPLKLGESQNFQFVCFAGGDRVFNSNGTFTGEAPQQTDASMSRVGKKAAGNLLDGKQWLQFPNF